MRAPLDEQDVKKAIERRRPSRVPMMIHFWNGPEAFEERAPLVQEIQGQYPDDVFVAGTRLPNYWDELDNPKHIPGYSWMNVPPPPAVEELGHDTQAAIRHWDQLDDILAAWPATVEAR